MVGADRYVRTRRVGQSDVVDRLGINAANDVQLDLTRLERAIFQFDSRANNVVVGQKKPYFDANSVDLPVATKDQAGVIARDKPNRVEVSPGEAWPTIDDCFQTQPNTPARVAANGVHPLHAHPIRRGTQVAPIGFRPRCGPMSWVA
jgi:hypothetical protein